MNDKLSLIHDLAVSEEAKNVESRVVSFNRGKSDRCLEVGTQVLMRVHGIHAALQAAWEGPYNVIDRVSRVTYRVSKGDGHPVRLAHLNNLKEYQERCKMVNAVTLVAEDQGISEELLVNKAVLSKDKCPNYNESGLKLALSGLDKYFSAKPGLCSVGVCDIVLKDGASVVNLPPRQIPGGIREAVRAEIDKLVSNGVIVESKSEWASPLVPVKKKDGCIRLCVNYRDLNSCTPLRRFWLPSLTEILEKVGRSLYLSTLDLTSGFHQIAMSESSSELTTFVCLLGKYKYCRMPFGLKNAPAIFQSVVEEVLTPVNKVCKNYIDDVVVYSACWDDHLVDLANIIRCLGEAGFTVKSKKCVFGRKYLQYLGHKIGGGVVAVPELRIKAMSEFLLPRTKKQLRSFLGSMSYYRKFVDSYAKLSSTLSPAVSLRAPQRVNWTEEMMANFCKLKDSLCNHVVITIPGPEDELVLYTDASGDGIGGCLHVIRSVTLRSPSRFSAGS